MKIQALMLVALLGTAGPVAAAVSNPDTSITVIFVEPQHFTDVKYTKASQHAVGLLEELQQFMQRLGVLYVPTGLRLDISITDIDLAGDFEPWRGLQFDQVRIIRDIYPPRISLEFRLTDDTGQIVSAGKRELSDIAYQTRLVRPLDDYLRYEKDMLRDWFRREFGQSKF